MMNWKDYEKQIFDGLKNHFPDSEIIFNKKLPGRFSKINRQIDILISGKIAGHQMHIICDCKFFSRKVDVKHVESFIGMMQDVGAHKGILLTNKGFTSSAEKRAYHDPGDLELDIVSFDELLKFQGPGGHIYRGGAGLLIPTPLGWIIDGTNRDRSAMIATLYHRGISFETSLKRKEFIYVNLFVNDSHNIHTIKSLIQVHEEDTRKMYPNPSFEYFDTVKRDDSKTQLRLIKYSVHKYWEYTGFLEFEDFTAMFVLHTPEVHKSRNLRHLEWILERAIPTKTSFSNEYESALSHLEGALEIASSNNEKAAIKLRIADVYHAMKDEKQRERYILAAVKLVPDHPETLIEYIKLKASKDENLQGEIEKLLEKSENNDAPFQVLFEIFHEQNALKRLGEFLGRIRSMAKWQTLTLGFLEFYLAKISLELGRKEQAKTYLENSKAYFHNSLPKEHYLFVEIDRFISSMKS